MPQRPTAPSRRRPVLASRPILITQISDLHITRPGALAYGRVDTATALLRTISTLNGLSPRPDLVVISGDIADSALPEEYAHATKLLGALKVPFVAIPGNHDRRPLMRESFPDSAYGEPGWALNKVRRVNGLDIVLIDSTVAGAAHGELDQRSNGLTAHSRRRQHDRHSCFCTIHRSTRASCTRTLCGCGTRMHSQQFSKAIRACCCSRQGTFIAPRKPSLQASQPAFVRPASRPSRLNSNRAGRRFSELNLRHSIYMHGFPDRGSEAW